jgi:hypothetical protein
VTRADDALAGSRPAPPPAGRRPGRRRRAGRAAGLAAAAVVLFLCYLRLSGTVPVNADGASNALQAWDMLHGNVLLHGWRLSDVSFYTTELPQYALVEAVRGLGPEVVHIAAAMTYTLLVLLAGLLAKGRATGREAVLRAGIAAGIMLAPQPGSASYTLLLSPDHVGTGVPLLLLWLIIDRARPRWYVPVTAGVLLAWAQVADSVTLIIGVAPVVIACCVRACRRDASRRYHLSLAAAAVASVPAAALAVRLIHGLGGYSVYAPRTSVSPAGALPRHLALAFQGVLELFGAGFAGQRPGLAVLFAVAHLAGLALAGLALGLAIGRFFRWEELVIPGLAAAIILNLAAYILSVTPVNIRSTREIASVLPFGAVLAGRLLAGPMLRAAGRLRAANRLARADRSEGADRLAGADRPAPAGRLIPLALASAAAAAALCYAAALGYDAAQPPVAANDQALAGWLASHHLTTGLAKYWHANNTTLDSGGRVQLITVAVRDGRPVFGDPRETDLSWRDPRSHYANFVVTAGRAAGQARLMAQALLTTLGRPARTYRFEEYTIRVWDRNLLSVLGRT